MSQYLSNLFCCENHVLTGCVAFVPFLFGLQIAQCKFFVHSDFECLTVREKITKTFIH